MSDVSQVDIGLDASDEFRQYIARLRRTWPKRQYRQGLPRPDTRAHF
ncbi:hypothetical protein [Halobellus sp. Atlit-38R]|nr:hypothetical protein [Halobellus sp. Atlit-38R]